MKPREECNTWRNGDTSSDELWLPDGCYYYTPLRRTERDHRLRFDSGKRAVETKLLKLVLFIADGIGTINL